MKRALYLTARNLRAHALKPGDLVYVDEDQQSYRVLSAEKRDGWLYTRFAGRPGEYLINPSKPLLVFIPELNPDLQEA